MIKPKARLLLEQQRTQIIITDTRSLPPFLPSSLFPSISQKVKEPVDDSSSIPKLSAVVSVTVVSSVARTILWMCEPTFCICSLWSHLNVLTFSPLTRGSSEGLDLVVQIFL